MTLITRSLPPELVPYAQALEDFKSETGIQLSLPPLGTGGGGTVLKARALDGKPLAVKVIAANDAASRDQALREASILKQVQYAKRFGGGDGLLWQRRTQQADLFVLAMDFIPGGTLTDLITARGVLAESVAIELTLGIAEELETLHAQHIIHRDVKPDNVMLMQLGQQLQPIVVDYGIAKVGKKTMRGAKAATDGYAPPEQYSGGTDQRADVYALGATLYEMVTGQTPPTSLNRDPQASLQPRQSNTKLSSGLELVLQIATAYAAQQRFASMRAMIDALHLARAGDEAALRSSLQALGLLRGGARPLADYSSALTVGAVPPVPSMPPLPLKSATPRPRAPKLPASVRKKACPYCQEPCQDGEVFCNDCGGALDPEVSVPPQSSASAVASSPGAAGNLIACTPGPQFLSLLFAHQIILGGPALGWVGKSLLLVGYWCVLAGVVLGARSLSILCGLFGWLPVVCAVLLFALFPLFAEVLRHWDDLTIRRRGQTHWLRRCGLLLLGLGGLGAMLYWVANEVAIWHSDWFFAPPPLSVLVYMGLVASAAVLVKGLLA
jgi:serine/threonine protein kinase